MAEEYTKRERARRVYSTALINKLIDDRNQGYDIKKLSQRLYRVQKK